MGDILFFSFSLFSYLYKRGIAIRNVNGTSFISFTGLKQTKDYGRLL
jgi:hypothetical protein